MANYGRVRYGQVTYGGPPQKKGTYISQVFYAGDLLPNTGGQLKWQEKTPLLSFEETTPYAAYTGTWVDSSTGTPSGGASKYSVTVGDTCSFEFAGTSIAAYSYCQGTTARVARYTLKQGETVIASQGIALDDPVGAWKKVWEYTDLEYGTYTLISEVLGGEVHVDKFEVGGTYIAASTRTSADGENWAAWVPVTGRTAGTPDVNTGFSAIETDIASVGNYYIQYQLELYTGDINNIITPEVAAVELAYGTIDLFATQATAVMDAVAPQQSIATKMVSEISWIGTAPAGTKVTLYTRFVMADDSTTEWSAAYDQISDDEVRLKQGETTGQVRSNTIFPTGVVTLKYLTAAEGIFERPTGTTLTVSILDADTNQVLPGLGDQALTAGGLAGLNAVTVPHKLYFRLSRNDITVPSPILRTFTVTGKARYYEALGQTGTLGGIDGKKEVIAAAEVAGALSIPAEASPQYTISHAPHPYLMFFWESQAAKKSTERLATLNTLEDIWGEGTSPKLLREGHQSVTYGTNWATGLDTIAPATESGKNYQYRVENGRSLDGVSFSDVNENVKLWWQSGDEDTKDTTLDDDMLEAESSAAPTGLEIPWLSGIIYYEGVCNLNSTTEIQNFISGYVSLPAIPTDQVVTETRGYRVVVKNVECVKAPGDGTEDLTQRITVKTVTPTMATFGTSETFTAPPNNAEVALVKDWVTSIEAVYDYQSGNKHFYTPNVDYRLYNNCIDWRLGGEEPSGSYTVDYRYIQTPVTSGVVTLGTAYAISVPQTTLWVSGNKLTGDGTCGAEDFEFPIALPAKDDRNSWMGLPNPLPTNLQYVITDDNPYVWLSLVERVDGTHVHGTLNGFKPKKNWLPRIHSGFYYIGKNEYYYYAEPVSIVASTTDEGGEHYLELIPTPKQGAPIIVETEDGKPLIRVVELNADNEYALTITQDIVSTGSRRLRLAYSGIADDFQPTAVDEDNSSIPIKFIGDDYIELDLTYAEGLAYAGQTFRVAYRVRDSFMVNLIDEKVRIETHEAHTNLHITYEAGEKFGDHHEGMADLNPLFNPTHTGFVYIPTEDNRTVERLVAYAHPNILKAGKTRPILICVDFLDKWDNPTDVIPISITARHSSGSNHGSIQAPAGDAPNPHTGRLIQYYTPDPNAGPGTVSIVVYDEQRHIGSQFTIALV